MTFRWLIIPLCTDKGNDAFLRIHTYMHTLITLTDVRTYERTEFTIYESEGISAVRPA